jgi:hypothetical protein
VPGWALALADVVEVLTRDDAPLPTIDPVLPRVWVVSLWDIGRLHSWSSENGWQTFPKDLSPADPSV